MALHFHLLTISDIRKETEDCVSIALDIPENLKGEFSYLPGQNITLKTTLDGEEIRRSYSICSAPHENNFRVAVKKIPNGKFSSFANDVLKTGDRIEVMAPSGNFSLTTNSCTPKQYLAFAAGSGITPVISILKAVLNNEPQSRFTLVYGNRTRQSIIFFEELEALKNKYLDRLNLIHLLSRETTDSELNNGKITAEKLHELNHLMDFAQFDAVFLCGPEQMIFCVKDFLESRHVDSKKIHFELFNSPVAATPATANSNHEDTGRSSKITVHVDGRQTEFDLGFNSQNILDAALAHGADLPFACKGGVCCTCKAKLMEGKVEMKVHWGLEQEEIDLGFILTCQSRPLTDTVVVDFDER